MALFAFEARQINGRLTTGETSAASRAALAEKLMGEGMVLISARAMDGARAKTGRLPALPRRRVPLAQMLLFLAEFRALSRSGMPLVRALKVMEVRPGAPVLAAALGAVRREVETGRALPDAMGDHPRAFPPILRAAIGAGGATGRMDAALDQLIGLLSMQDALERKARRATTYPLFLLALLAVVLVALMLFVLPRFADLYGEFGAALPWPTRVLMALAEAAPWGVPLLVVAVLGAAAGLRMLERAPGAALALARMRLRLPVIGPLVLEIARTRTAAILSMLLASGMPLRPALRAAAEGSPQPEIAARLIRAADAVGQGRGVAEALSADNLFEGVGLSMVAAGEAAGALAPAFEEAGLFHRDRLQDRLDRTLALIEPAMMLFVGVALGGVVIAVYLPIFGLSGIVR